MEDINYSTKRLSIEGRGHATLVEHHASIKNPNADAIAQPVQNSGLSFITHVQCLLTGMESCSRIAKNKDKEPGTSYPTDRRDIGAACFQI